MSVHSSLRDQFDQQTDRLAQERRDGIARTLEADRTLEALREAHKQSRARLQKVNVDLRATNVEQRLELRDLKGLVGLRNGDVACIRREAQDAADEIVELISSNENLRNTVVNQRARLANVGIMLDALREQMSVERAQVALNRAATAKDSELDMYRAGLRYNALKFDLRKIGRLSSNASDGDAWADLMKINAIAQKG